MALTLRHPPAPAKPPTPATRRSAGSPGRKPFLDNTQLLLAGIVALIAGAGRPAGAGSRSSALAPDFLAEFVLYALSATNLTILVALRLRAGAQHRQAGRRAAPGAAVRALPRQARDGAARDDADSRGARADRRQRAHSQQRRPLVQRADGRSAVVGQRESPATTTRSSSGSSRRRRSAWRAR